MSRDLAKLIAGAVNASVIVGFETVILRPPR